MNERTDLYQRITDKIVTALEQGTPPWVSPWGDHSAVPSNLLTGKPYRGINILMLFIEAMDRGYADSRWLTLRQANELGGRIRRLISETGTELQKVMDFCGVEKLEDIAKSEASRVIRSLEQSRNRKEAA